VTNEICEDGGSASSHVCDIRDEAAVAATIDAVLAAHRRLDGLVNNAGGQYRAAMSTISTKGFDAVVRANLTGGFIFMREAYNRWMAKNGGAIVNVIADIWHGWPDFSHSGAARRHADTKRDSGMRMGGVGRSRQLRGTRRHSIERLR
jgi:citronellol/citronellal dehydrogenase